MARTAGETISQVLASVGNLRIQTWCLSQLNTLLQAIYREHDWPFLCTPNVALTTGVGIPGLAVGSLPNFWKPKIVQIASGTTLYPITPIPGGLPAYFGDLGRLERQGRPSKYAFDRYNQMLAWDSIPNAVEAVHLLYQADPPAVATTDIPLLSKYTRNGELYLHYALLAEVNVYIKNPNEALAIRKSILPLQEASLLAERLDDTDSTPKRHGNEVYR